VVLEHLIHDQHVQGVKLMSEAEWLASADIQSMLAFLRGRGSERKMILFACACCHSILRLLKDERSRRALDVALCWAEGNATDQDRDVANNAAKAACQEWEPHSDEWYAARAAQHALGACYPVKSGVLADDAPLIYFQPYAAACEADNAIMGDDSAEQIAFLRDIFGNPFQTAICEPVWMSPIVTPLAQAIYDNRVLPSGQLDEARLMVLADALEEAGCTNAHLVSHLRSLGPHVQGCWAVDQCLSRS
jgi:hypothetical protein